MIANSATATASDFQRTLDLAVAFFLAGERCRPTLAFGAYGEHRLDAPPLVLYAHALEIGLKLLLRILNIEPPKGGNRHEITRLYALLPEDSKVHLQWMEDHINDMNSYFVDWRYAFEHEFLAGSTDEPRRSFILVHSEIRRQRPDLLSVFERGWGHFQPDWQWSWPEKEITELEAASS